MNIQHYYSLLRCSLALKVERFSLLSSGCSTSITKVRIVKLIFAKKVEPGKARACLCLYFFNFIELGHDGGGESMRYFVLCL